MFRKLLMPLWGVCWTCFVQAQTCAPNGITTNPAAPVNTQRPSKLNRFDFRRAYFPLNTSSAGINTTSIRSPFFDDNNEGIRQFYDIAPDDLKEIYTGQGWELIKAEFGYNDDQTPRSQGTTECFFVMYNKYTGILRVFVARLENNPYTGAVIQIGFGEGSGRSPMQTSLLDHANQIKALNAAYVAAPKLNNVPYFLNQPLKWFYADFPMNYDACTCLYQSNLTIEVKTISAATVTGTTTNAGSIVSNAQPTNGASAPSSTSFGSQLFETSKKVVKTYKDSYVFTEDIKKFKPITYSIDEFGKDIKKVNFLKAGLKAIPYLGDALSILDFFVGVVRHQAARRR